MSNEETFGAEGSESNPGRRRVLKAAAWSAPVIALAVATPMAAASITNTQTGLTIANAGNIAIASNTIGAAVTGTFSGSATVANVGIGWNLDGATVTYELSGPIVATSLLFNNAPITASTITSNGRVWAVLANEANYLELALLSPLPIAVPADGATQVPFPTITYATTLTSVASRANRVRAESTGTVTSNGASLQDGNFKLFPA